MADISYQTKDKRTYVAPVSRQGLPKFIHRIRQGLPLYLVLLPVFILLGIFSFYPAISGMYHSLFEWTPGLNSPYVGLDNFVAIGRDPLFWRSLRNIAVFFSFGVTVMWAFPLLAAEMIITLTSARLQTIFRTLLIIPMAFPVVVQLLLWSFIYNPQYGVLNTFLRGVGLGELAKNWLGDPTLALFSLMFVNAPWIASVPFLIFLSGLQAIPSEVLDAASLDGANRIQRFVAIDVPLLAGQFRLLIILAVIQFLQLAVPVALLTQGGPSYSTLVPGLYVLNTAFVNGEWGYSAAISTVIFFITFGLSLFIFLTRKPTTRKVA